ncbi:MAG TPA: glycosyltransferase family 4 protein [Steroidobacteraceae bacterium]
MTEVAGSEMRVVELYKLLREAADVTVWSEWDSPDPSLARAIPIRALRPRHGEFPLTGTLVFVGFWFAVGRWAWLSMARRRIILCNTMPKRPESFINMRRRVSCGGIWPVEFAYSGLEVARAIGLPGPILPSPIDLVRLTPNENRPRNRDFTVGRMSRDVADKHHGGAPALYQRLISAGCAVRIMGGTVLRSRIPDPTPGLELLPLSLEDVATFMRGLDCFLYRTNDNWFETFGRVVFEAMACGLPVVAHRRGGYSHFLHDGEDALLFDTDEEAHMLVMRLKTDAALRARIARNASQRVEDMYSATSLADMTRYFLAQEPDQNPVAPTLGSEASLANAPDLYRANRQLFTGPQP